MARPKSARCSLCGQTKRLSEFAPSELYKNKTGGRCRECNRARRLPLLPVAIPKLRAWEAQHPERRAERRRVWLATDRGKAARKLRTKRLKENGGSHTAAEWADLCGLYGGMCLCCGATDKPLTKDHVKPIMQGGGDCIENLQPLCADCNSRKGGRWIDYRIDWEAGE